MMHLGEAGGGPGHERGGEPSEPLGLHERRYRLVRLCSGSEAGSYLRLIDLCITQL